MSVSRRRMLGLAAATAAFGGLARVSAQPAQVFGYGPLRPDPDSLFDLPEGFSYKIVSRAGQPMDDGFLTPGKLDGMACFPLDAERVILVRNHELRSVDAANSPFGRDGALAAKVPKDRAFDILPEGRPLAGGTSTLVWNLRQQRLETHHLSLTGTVVNCAGGRTPRRTWLSCEESDLRPGSEAGKAHGWVFEVPADLRGLADPTPITGMGRFKHEATATDPRTGVVYLTEDQTDGEGLFYRYLPSDPARLHAGGRLQALGFREGAEADPRNWKRRYWKVGERRNAVWIDLDGVDNPHDDLRHRGHAAGAAWFARGEGIVWGDGELYFTCTSGGPDNNGQVLRYRPSPREGQPGEKDQPGVLQLFVEPASGEGLTMCDNLTVSPRGHLFVCEDKYMGRNRLQAITPRGRIYDFGSNAQGRLGPAPNSELAGVCFSPDGSTLFVNIYSPGITLAITGPWAAFRA